MPFDPDDFTDQELRQRLSLLVPAVTEEDFERVEPPAGLWDSIAQRIELDAKNMPRVGEDTPPQAVADLDAARRKSGRGVASLKPLLLAAAAALLVAGVVTAVVLRSSKPAETVVASAKLELLEPLGSTSASARLVTRDGTTSLVVDAKNMPPAGAGEKYELWLVDTGVTDPRSLGVVTGSEQVVVPSSIDPKTHPVVDISLEPDDGDHHHSGHSLMRGTLR